MKIYAIAINTLKEAVRDKIFYSLLFFAVLMLGASVLLSTLTLGEQSKIIEDLSLAATDFFGVIIAIFVGIGLVNKELEKKTIYTIISKPISRMEFLLGKYAGLALTLLMYLGMMTVCFMAVLFLYCGILPPGLLVAVLFIYVELLVVTAAALLFSTFSTPTLSATYTLAIYMIGHMTGDIKALAGRIQAPAAKAVLDAFYYILPNLGNFNIKAQAVHGVAVPAGYAFTVMVYGLVYVAGLLVVSMMVFQRRNFK